MRNVSVLLRVQLVQAWRSFRDRSGTGSRWALFLLPFLLVCIGGFIAIVSGFYAIMFFTGRVLGQSQMVLTLALTGGQVIALMFGVFYLISAFYFSQDASILLPMPLHPAEIVLAKFLIVLAGEYLTIAPIVLPGLVVYGLLAQVSWTYIPFALVIFLLLPVIPLVLSAVFAFVLMRVTNLRRNRDLVRVIGALLGVGLSVAFQLFGTSRGGPVFLPTEEAMADMLQMELIQSAGRYFPTSIWGTNALTAGAPFVGAGFLIVFVCAAAAALLLLVGSAEQLFLGGLVGGEEVRATGRLLGREELAKRVARAGSPLWALFSREVRLLNRTPIFLLTAVLPLITAPLVLLLPMLQQKEMAGILALLRLQAGNPVVTLVTMGVLLALNGFSSLPASTLSREGRSFWVSRMLPVAPHVQVRAKALHCMVFSLVPLAMVLTALGLLGLLTVSTGLCVVVGGLAISAITVYVGLAVDLLHPCLTWTDPQQATRGNLNGLLAVVGDLIIGIILALVIWLANVVARSFMLPITLLVVLGIGAALQWLTGAMADRYYPGYED